MDAEELTSYLDTFDESISNSGYITELRDRAEILKKVAVGQPYIDFTLNDTTGNPVALSDLVGKSEYLLVDFWAAWCGPCRGENPNIVAMYHKYKDKGFDVLGVSFDRNREAWVKAINDDGLEWTHISDLQYWNSAAGKLYAVSSIPHSILLDKEGVIIEKNLRGEGLQEKLAELFE